MQNYHPYVLVTEQLHTQQVVEGDAKQQHPLYEVRTPEEAQKFWQTQFGHLESPSAAEKPRS